MTLGYLIANRRREIGKTQQDIADALDVSIQAVSAWERDEYLPDTSKLKPLANALSTSVGYLMGEGTPLIARWQLDDEMFSADHMYRFVHITSKAKKMHNTAAALKLMKKYHEGQYRKGKDHLPYIVHPLMMACHAFSMEIDDDELIPVLLLHDVVEDCGVTVEELDFNENIKTALDLVSFELVEGKTKEESLEIYYKKISQNRLASMVKIIDRCNNISTMSTCFSKEKIADYIDETEKYVMPLLDMVKHTYGEYYNAAFILKYHMLSILESLKRMV